ncbi:MAG TPA: DUF5009 domain-containing protein [Spirochaetota bacterium]|nr:DUF5009 domain-containing protein [Spirochaetota bacterium]
MNTGLTKYAAPANRLLSLDTFRGLTIAAMILVNNAGDWGHVFGPLRHARWHGWTMADLVFPFFVFIMGAAIPLALGRRLEKGESHRRVACSVLQRTVILLVLGFLLNILPGCDFAAVRIPGVLQRLALCYLMGSLVFLASRRPALWCVAALALMAAHWAVLAFAPVPGYGPGVLEPEGNAAWYVDSRLFAGHTYRHAPAPGFDPEGLLGTLSAAATALFGMLTGAWMKKERIQQNCFRGLFAAANGMIVAGLVMNELLPINKNLWTPAFAVFTAGFALYFLLMCFWVMDVKRWLRPAIPFVALGSNALAVYVLSSLVAKTLVAITVAGADGKALSLKTVIFTMIFASWMEPYTASLAYAMVYLFLWGAVAVVIYRRNIFIRV